MDYYVYIYLDPRKPGRYNYQNYYFDYEPFYIGKGKDHRYKIHLHKVKLGNYKDLLKNYIIRDILNEGLEPIIIKYQEEMDEQSSLNLEKDIIIKIGRVDLKTGPLTNLSNGGQGYGNRYFSKEHRNKLSLARKKGNSEKQKEHLDNIHERMIGNKRTLGFKFSEESKKKLAESHYKSVFQIGLYGEILNEFPSIKDAESYIGVSIKKVLRGDGKTAGGFFWKYKDDFENNKIIDKINNRVKKDRIGKEIIMMDINMNILREYRTITEASKDTNISIGNISKNLTGKGKTAGGFLWMYKNNY